MKFHYRLGWVVARGIARALWGFRGLWSERIPNSGPVVIACNHVSNWDPILVGLGCRREVHFLAKEELFRNPLLRWLIRAYNALPLRRGIVDRRALRLASEVLEGGGALVMFPEGTRSRDGKLGRGKPGVGYLACASGGPVIPAYITGTEALARAFRTRVPVRVAYGEPIWPEGREGHDDHMELTERVMGGIAALREEVDAT